VSTTNNTVSADWVKWVAGLALTLSGTAFGYAINTEHRQTATETTLENHINDAKETKQDVYQRLKATEDKQAAVLESINAVRVDVAAIRGALGIKRQQPIDQ